jgi:hypothetical protein
LHFAAALDLADIAASIVARGASTDLKNSDNAIPENLVSSANTRSVLEAAIKQRPAIKALRQGSLVSNSVFKQNLQNTGNNRMAKTRIPEYSSKDRFTELRRLAESSSTGSDQRVVTKKDISSYIQPGMLEQKKKGLSMEEVQREERIRQAKRRAEVEQLVTKKVVNTSRFVTERSNSIPDFATIAADHHNVLPSTSPGSERKFSALKEKSYVSTSVFRQQSAESDDAEERSPTSKFQDADDAIHDEQLVRLKIGDQHIYDADTNTLSADLGEADEYEEATVAEEPEAYYNEEEDENDDYVSTEEYEAVADQEENDDDVDIIEDNATADVQTDGDSLDNDAKEEAEEVEPSVPEPVEDTMVDVPEEVEDFRQPKITERNIRDSVPHPIKLLGLDDNDPNALNAAFQRIIITPAQDIAEETDRFDNETTLLRPRSNSSSSAISNNSIVHDVEPVVPDTATQWDTGVTTLESTMSMVDQQDNTFYRASNDNDDQFISDTASILDISFPSSRLNFDDDVISFRSFDDQPKPSSSLFDKTLPQKPDQRDYFGSISVARTSTYTRKASTDSDRPSLASLETKTTAQSGAGASFTGSDLRIDTGSITFSKSTGLTNLPISQSIRRKPIGLVPEKTKSEVIPRSQERSTSRQGSYLIDDDDVPLSATSRSPPALKNQEAKPSLRSVRPQVSHLRGKLLVRICRFNVEPTLTKPKEPFHLRCILTDGKNEYQSQYTQLGNEIDINQGCLISAFPDMKFRLSLQARSDAYVKPKKQLTRLLSTAARKQPNTVLNLVNKDDGHFGQTRIQLRSIAHLCRNSLYTAAFDCYNNWSAISKAGSKANAVRDNLVVVGNLVLQLYFIPHVDGVRVSDPSHFQR